MNTSLAGGIVLTFIVVALSITMIVYGSRLTKATVDDLASPHDVLIAMGSIGLAACIGFWIFAYFENKNDFQKVFMFGGNVANGSKKSGSPFSHMESPYERSIAEYNESSINDSVSPGSTFSRTPPLLRP